MLPSGMVLRLRWLLPSISLAMLVGAALTALGSGVFSTAPSPLRVWAGLTFSVGGIVALTLVGRSLVVHLGRFHGQLSRFAEGDLSDRLPLDSRFHECGLLARAINTSGEAQSAMVNELREATTALERESKAFQDTFQEIQTLSRHSLDASSTVAAAVEELTAGMASMANEAKQVDLLATDTLAGSRKIQELSSDAALLVQQQESTLRETSNSLALAVESTETLARSGKTIAGMAASIQDVAKRTRLLALNASIEAVRAGRAGAGFAVVAQEVKELARQAGSLAQEIQSQVDAVGAGTEEVSSRIQRTKESMELLEAELASAREASSKQRDLARTTQTSQQTTSESVSHVARTIDESRMALQEIARSTVDVQSRAKAVQASVAKATSSITDLQRLSRSFHGTVREVRLPRPFFPWTDQLELGIPRMDDQHRVLLRLINRVADLSASGGGGAAIRIILGQLVDYTKFHFGDEETLMKEAGFPALDGHHQQHVAFVEEVGKIVTAAGEGETLDPSQILSVLKDWLTRHIQGTDRQYARHILGSKR